MHHHSKTTNTLTSVSLPVHSGLLAMWGLTTNGKTETIIHGAKPQQNELTNLTVNITYAKVFSFTLKSIAMTMERVIKATATNTLFLKKPMMLHTLIGAAIGVCQR